MQDGLNTSRQQQQLDNQLLYSNNFSDSRIEKLSFERQRQVPLADSRARNSTLSARREQPSNATVPQNVDTNLQTLQAMFPDHSVDVLKRILLQANCDVNEAVSAIITQDTPPNNFNV